MNVHQFDAAPAAQAEALLRGCVGIDAWVATLSAARPFGTREALLAAARTQAGTWSRAEVDGALADHSRIGERPAGAGPGATASRAEQAGVDPHDADVQARLLAGNRAYEERFGRIFLVRAKGRSAEDILALLEQRLGHDDDVEAAVVAEQLAEIALLRLADAVTEDASAPAEVSA